MRQSPYVWAGCCQEKSFLLHLAALGRSILPTLVSWPPVTGRESQSGAGSVGSEHPALVLAHRAGGWCGFLAAFWKWSCSGGRAVSRCVCSPESELSGLSLNMVWLCPSP